MVSYGNCTRDTCTGPEHSGIILKYPRVSVGLMTGSSILIVEDDGIIAMSLMQLLSGYGNGIVGTVAS